MTTDHPTLHHAAKYTTGPRIECVPSVHGPAEDTYDVLAVAAETMHWNGTGYAPKDLNDTEFWNIAEEHKK